MRRRSTWYWRGRFHAGPLRDLPAGWRSGDGVFETVRTYEGRPFRLAAHIARLRIGARSIDLPAIPSAALLTAVAETLLKPPSPTPRRSGERVLRLYLFAEAHRTGFAANVERAPLRPAARRPRVVDVGSAPYVHPGGNLRPSSDCPAPKWMSRGPLSHALRRARGVGWEEALLRDARGRYVEGTRSNLVVIRGRTVLAPGVQSGALPGVTRDAVVGLARRAGYEVIDRPVAPPELRRASEAFLVSTLLGVTAIGSVDGHPVGGPRAEPGPVSQELARAFAELVRREGGPRGRSGGRGRVTSGRRPSRRTRSRARLGSRAPRRPARR